MTDNVNHPGHYESQAIGLEPIDFCERLPFCEGNALKYCFRAGHKAGSSELEDLKKAEWYLFRADNFSAVELTEAQKKNFEYVLNWLERSASPLIANSAAQCLNYQGFFNDLLSAVQTRIAKLEEKKN